MFEFNQRALHSFIVGVGGEAKLMRTRWLAVISCVLASHLPEHAGHVVCQSDAVPT